MSPTAHRTLNSALAMSDPGPADHLSEQTSKQIHELWSMYVADSADESCVTLDEYLNVTDRVDRYLAAFNPRGDSGESEKVKRERKETMFNEELADQVLSAPPAPSPHNSRLCSTVC